MSNSVHLHLLAITGTMNTKHAMCWLIKAHVFFCQHTKSTPSPCRLTLIMSIVQPMKAHVDHVRPLSAHMKAHIHNVWSLFVLLESHCDVVALLMGFTTAKKARIEEPQGAVPGQEVKSELLMDKVASLEWADTPARHQSAGGGFTFDEFWLHHQGHWYDYNWWENDGCNSGVYWVWDEVGGWRRHRTSGDKLSATGGGWMNKMAAVLHMFKNNRQGTSAGYAITTQRS